MHDVANPYRLRFTESEIRAAFIELRLATGQAPDRAAVVATARQRQKARARRRFYLNWAHREAE